jgi:hypothetical protein
MELEVAKVIKANPAFVAEFRRIRDGVMRNESAVGLQDRLQKLSTAISNSTQGQLPEADVLGFLTNKVQAQASPAVRQEVMAQQEDPQRAPTPEMVEGDANTLPGPQSEPSVAPMALPEETTAPVQTPETQVTATTPDQAGLSPEEMAMLEAADEQVAGQREQVDPQKPPVDVEGARQRLEISPEAADRMNRQRLLEMSDNDPEWVKKNKLKDIRSRRREIMDFGSLNPVDDLYVLFDEVFGPTGIRPFEARNSMADPESYTRGSKAMRMSLFHFALGQLQKGVPVSPLIKKLRSRFDAIMRELGVDQELIDTVRGERDIVGSDPDVRKPHVGKYIGQNVTEQRKAIDDIIRIIDKLKDGGSLRHPDVAPSLHVLTQFISDIDSDIINNEYIDFNANNEYGQKIETQIDNLELVTQGLVDRVAERTGQDLRTVLTEEGSIRRPGWSPFGVDGATFTTQNVIRYETSSRRRYALDMAGLIDSRWQQVDAQGLDVPSFINKMHPEPDSTKAAIGFILTTDPTTALHHAAGGRGKRETMRESAIIKEIKDYLSSTDFNDTSNSWDDLLDGDIGVGDNIEYTLDSSVVESEVARRRSLLPPDRLVIVRLDPEEFPIGSVLQDGKGNAKGIVNKYGILVLPEGHPLVQQAIQNNARITSPFALGTVIDTSAIVEKGEFPQLLVDVDPHVFPAVKHTLPLRGSKNWGAGTVALVPQIFLDEAPADARIQLRDENGIPSPRRMVYQTFEDGTLITAAAPERAKAFSGRGPEGVKKQIPGIEDVQAATPAEGSWEGKAVVLAKSIDVSAASPDWPEGIAVGIVANDNGDFPNLGTLADRYLADIDEYDTRRRWVVGDMLGTQQGDDRPRGIMTEDPFYGRAHGAVTDAEMERGLALIREQEAAIEAGTPKREMPALSPEDEELLGKVRGRTATNRKYSPARSPYDASEIFALSEDEWAVAQRTKSDRRTGVVETADPFLADIEEGPAKSTQPLSPEVQADVRKLKGKLLFLLTIRATKANFDRRNNELGTRSVGDIVGFAPEIAAIRQELSRVGVTAAAVDTFIEKIGDRMPELNVEQKALLRSDLAKPMLVTLEGVTPVSSLGGLSVSSRASGAEGMQFLTPAQAGVNPLDRLDKIAYTIASQMASEHQLSRMQGQNTVSLDALISDQADREVTTDADLGIDDQTKMETADEIASIMSETPGQTRSTFQRRLPPSKRTKAFAGINTAEELRIVARKAYTMYSLFSARDEAGDGWVRFIDNVLHSDGAAAAIGDAWKQSGEAAILVDNRLFASKMGEIPMLVTKDGREVGFLSNKFIKILERNTDYGSELIKFAKQSGLEFVLIKKPLRDASGKIVPGSFTDEVYITKAETDKSGKKFLNFADVSDMSSKYGYQALADDTSFTKTEERVRTMLKDNGSDTLFDVVPATDNSGRYILRVRPEALIEFGLFPDSKQANKWIENVGESYDQDRIRQYKIMLDAMVKFKFQQDMNALADRLGIDQPYQGATMESVLAETKVLYKDNNGISSAGETSGPFGIRRAIFMGNQNIPGEGVVPRVISRKPLPAAAEDDWVRYLSYGEPDYRPGADPMLDDALNKNAIIDDPERGLNTRRLITTGRAGSPESGDGRRVETETTRAMFRRARASNAGGRLASVLNTRKGGFAAGSALSLGMMAAQGGKVDEEAAKTAIAFEALGAVNPAAAAVASLGFTGMNKGDMLRTLVNIIGGFGGAAVGSIAGTAVLPVGGSFAGGMAGSVAGSAIADGLYSNLVGNSGGVEYVPNNVATVSEPAVSEEKDPFSVYKKLGG